MTTTYVADALSESQKRELPHRRTLKNQRAEHNSKRKKRREDNWAKREREYDERT